MYIVSIQQTVHSALLRGFEPYFATESIVYMSTLLGWCAKAVFGAATNAGFNVCFAHI